MKKIIPKILIIGLIVSVVFTSCRKNRDADDSAEIAQQSSLAEKNANDIGIMTIEVSKGVFQTFAASCATLTYDTTSALKTITIDFGSSDCLCNDGKNRRGSIEISAANSFTAVGSVITAKTNNYFVDNNQIDGNRTTTLTSATETAVVSAFTVTLPEDRGSFTWNGNFIRKYISGNNTPYLADDEYTLTGLANGVNTKGKDYTIEITDALQIQLGCRWIKGGILTISSPSIKNKATLEYGDGTCDNKALLKYGKKERTITL